MDWRRCGRDIREVGSYEGYRQTAEGVVSFLPLQTFSRRSRTILLSVSFGVSVGPELHVTAADDVGDLDGSYDWCLFSGLFAQPTENGE